jgi:hypothetical protein
MDFSASIAEICPIFTGILASPLVLQRRINWRIRHSASSRLKSGANLRQNTPDDAATAPSAASSTSEFSHPWADTPTVVVVLGYRRCAHAGCGNGDSCPPPPTSLQCQRSRIILHVRPEGPAVELASGNSRPLPPKLSPYHSAGRRRPGGDDPAEAARHAPWC